MTIGRRILALVKPDGAGERASGYTFLAEKLIAFATRGIEVHTVSPHVEATKLTSEGIRIHPLPRLRSLGNTIRSLQLLADADFRSSAGTRAFAQIREAAVQRAIESVIRSQQIDLVYSAFGWPSGSAGITACRRTHTPVVLSLHGADVFVEPSIGYGQTLGALGRHRMMQTLAAVDYIVAMSSALAERAVALGASPSRLAVVLQGVDTDRFSPGDQCTSRKRLGLADRPTILFAGNLVPAKGIGCLLDACDILRRAMPSVQLVLCGDGSERDAIRRRVSESGLQACVALPGRVGREVMPDYFRACDVFALPSLTEGAGYVIIEAAACAKPVVAASVGGIPDYVSNGVNGLLFRKADASDLAERLLFLFQNPVLVRQLGRAGRALVEERHRYEQMITQMMNVFERTIGIQSPHQQWHPKCPAC